MEIVINEVDFSSMDIVIDFSTEFGSGKGLWNGNKKPEQGKKYQVEYDITDVLEWGTDIQLSNEKAFKIFTKQECTYITGLLESLGNDGFCDFRFGDNLIQLEIEGKNLVKGHYIEIKADSLEVYEKSY